MAQLYLSILIILAYALATALTSGAATAGGDAKSAGREQSLKLYDKITSIVETDYYDSRARSNEFKQVIAEQRKKVNTHSDAISASRAAINALHDPFTTLFAQPEISARAEHRAAIKQLPLIPVKVIDKDGKQRTANVPLVAERLAINASWLDENTVLLRISDFDNLRMPQQFQAAMSTLKVASAKKMILDLRDNGGGLVTNAAQVLGFLMGNAQGIANVHAARGDRPLNLQWPATNPQFKGELVVLVNHGTASASELVAATIQHRHRGKIVGEKTYGANLWKGDRTVEPGLVLYLCIAQWSVSPGKFAGVSPDEVVKQNPHSKVDDQLNAARRALI